MVANDKYKPQIDTKEGLFVNAWVRAPSEIPPMLTHLNVQVAGCIAAYIERIEEARRTSEGDSASHDISPEQAELNQVIDSLCFDPPAD